MKKEYLLISFLAIAAIITITLQISISDTQLTQRETTLFNVLQFIFSVAFAWLLSKNTSKEEFEKQQRSFAVSAFRRIKEIETQTTRLINKIQTSMKGDDDDYYHALDLARELAISIRETTLSSKLDWADIIGDQIETLERIENIQDTSGIEKSGSDENDSDHNANYDIEQLKKSLVSELKLFADERNQKPLLSMLKEELEETGKITLTGFTDSRMILGKEPQQLKVGEVITVKLGDHGHRVGTLGLYDSDGNYVGSLINKYPTGLNSYSDFTHSVCKVIGSSEFKAMITSKATPSKKSDRYHFGVEIKTILPA